MPFMAEAKRIIVCGLNGAGKSTFGRALAAELGCTFFDIEDFYFPERRASEPYAASLPREEVAERLAAALRANSAFVLASVTADYGGGLSGSGGLPPCARCGSRSACAGPVLRQIRGKDASRR